MLIDHIIPGVDRTFAAYDYAFPIDKLIQQAKFEADWCAMGVLEHCFARLADAACVGCDAVVPIPLTRERFVLRGFNQAHELARALSVTSGVPVRAGAITRRASRTAQSRLSARARRANVQGAFEARARWSNAHVLLVDDVVTTGATLSAAAECLRSAGAARVTAAVLAATPLRRRT